MSTLEATVSLLENMPEKEQEKVYYYVCSIAALNNDNSPFMPISREQVIADLALSSAQFEQGLGIDAKEGIMALRRQHGFI